MDTRGLTLLVPERTDPERDAVASEWTAGGGKVLRLGRFWDPPALDRAAVRVYGNDAFCLVLEQKLGLSLVSPPDELIAGLDPEFLGREMRVVEAGALSGLVFPQFVKSLIPKQIRSRVYESAVELMEESRGLDASTRFLASPPVVFMAEARCFVLGDEVLDVALYEGHANPSDAGEFAARVAGRAPLPSTVVVDVGLLDDGRWVVIEFNASWGAGLNGCDPGRVLPAIEAATRT